MPKSAKETNKDIKRSRVEVAQTLSPNFASQKEFNDMKSGLETVDIDGGKSYAQKRVKQKVTMTGTTKTVAFPAKHGFKDYKAVVVTLSAETHISVYGAMTGPNTFKITAESSLTAVDVFVLMRGR